ncbi:MAG: hypothetical protein Q9164_001950 [Protoblastenia rupestris]
MIDDLDDIYDTSPTTPNSVKQIPPSGTPTNSTIPASVPAETPQLPGLGISEDNVQISNGRQIPDVLISPQICENAAELNECPENNILVREQNEQRSPPPERPIIKSEAVEVPDAGKELESVQQSSNDVSQEGTRVGFEIRVDDEPSTKEAVDTSISQPRQVTPLGSASVSRLAFEEMAEAKKTLVEAEFEIDSSPFEDSSSDTSDDSSSSNESAAEDYEMLDPEEQARRLMAEDGGSDDEGGGKGSKPTGPLRTLNEKPDEIVPKPNIVVTENMKIHELGLVENTIENLVLIKAKTSGEYQVLEFDSVLCLEDRTVIGVVAETLGRVQQPYYSVRFTNEVAISEAAISKDTRIFYVEQHSTYIFTQPLKAFKGSDASNIHDEEIGDDELEFSDDEAEAEHKRRVKQQRQARRGGREGNMDGFSRGPRTRGRGGPKQRGAPHAYSNSLQPMQEHPPRSEAALNYDDGDGMSVDGQGDGLYTPLARPINLHEIMGKQEIPMEGRANGFHPPRGGASRGRGNRDRGFHRGRGRGHGRGQSNSSRGASIYGPYGNADTHGHANGYASNGFPALPAPPQEVPHFPHPHLLQQQQSSYPAWSSHPEVDPNQHQYRQNGPNHHQYNPSQKQHDQWHNAGQQQQAYQNFPPAQQAYQAPQQTSTYPTSLSSIPPGAHINPAFFRQQAQNAYPQSWQYQQQTPYANSQGHNG